MEAFNVTLEPLELESPLTRDISSLLWKLNIHKLKKMHNGELISLYNQPHISKNYRKMVVMTLCNRGMTVDGKKIYGR